MPKFNVIPQWLAFLLAFFCPQATAGVEGADDTPGDDDGPGDDADEISASDDGESDESDDGDADDGDDGDAGTPPVRKAAKSESDGRADEAVRLAREAAESVRALTERQNQRPDPTFAAEDAKLADPATGELERWQIQSNRALRDAQAQSRQALFQAQDMADKTDYAAKGITNPVYAKYQEKVEKELATARSKGANPPREMVLDLMIGRDLRLGNFKAKAEVKTAKQIPRGKPTGARSDTPVRGSQSDRQKRAARLADRQI